MRIRKNFTRKNGKVISINVQNQNNSNRNFRKTIRNNIKLRTYRLYDRINFNIRKKLKEIIKDNTIDNERELSYIYIIFNGDYDFENIIKAIKDSGQENNSLLVGKICYIMYLSNIWKKNIISNPKYGTFLRESQKNVLKNIKLQKNPETNFYFLKPGSGKVLLNTVLKELKEEEYNTIILQATSDNLVKYYQTFGFSPFPEKIDNQEETTYMYLHL